VESNSPKSQDIVDTTDSLEAIGVCRSMKNLLFFVLLLSLLLTQMIFWLDRLELIEKKICTPCCTGKVSCPDSKGVCPPIDTVKTAPATGGPLPLAAAVNVAEEVEKVTEQVNEEIPARVSGIENDVIADTEKESSAELPPMVQEQTEEAAETPIRIPFKLARLIVVICNFFIIAGSILYCLTILMCLKISLTGRLGGMNHITRAFFISLFFMVFVFPWQQLLPGVLVGAVWLPKEFFGCGWAKADEMAVWKVLFYLRFCGLWLLAIWFLFWAQSRSAKWARATLRRLGIVR